MNVYSGVVVGLTVISDYLNTIDERSFSRHGQAHTGGERLTSPKALADWLADHELADPAIEVGPADLTAAITLRTAVRQSLSGDGTDGAALADHPLVLAPDDSGGLRLAARSGRPWLDAIVETVAVAACRGDWARVKLCAAPDCRWAFHDASRSGRGRWCEMNVCGNRHKTRAYRERHQQAT